MRGAGPVSEDPVAFVAGDDLAERDSIAMLHFGSPTFVTGNR